MAFGWGLDPYGTSSYGSSVKGIGIHIVSAAAISAREVKVTLSGNAQHVTSSAPGDALNPTTWVIQRLDTAEFLNVVAVEPFTPEIYILTSLQNFGDASVTHRVSSSTLLDEAGEAIISPRSADFLGAIAAETVNALTAAAQRRVTPRDLANAPTPSTEFGTLGGTLQVSAGGDYKTVTGPELLKKLVIRRLITRPGEFFHLPNYGAGIKVKEPLNVGDLSTLKANVEAQAKREPEVEDAQATILVSENALTVQLRVKIKGQQQAIDVNVAQPASVVL